MQGLDPRLHRRGIGCVTRCLSYICRIDFHLQRLTTGIAYQVAEEEIIAARTVPSPAHDVWAVTRTRG